MAEVDLKLIRNISVIMPQGKNIGWWEYETDPIWWILRLWLRRN